MALAQQTEDAILNWILGSPFPEPPKEIYLALHSGEQPALANEIKGWAGGDRLRVASADFRAADNTAAGPGSGRERRNSRALMLGVHRQEQTVQSFGLWDAAVDGQLLIGGRLAAGAMVIAAGNPPLFLIDDLALQVL